MRKIIFVNRYYWPDHSATSQILTDLTVDLADRGVAVHVLASRLSYDDPSIRYPARETHWGIHIHRVATTRFGRSNLLGRAVDYASFYLSATWKAGRLSRSGDILVVKTDPPMLSIPMRIVTRLRGTQQINWLQDLYPELAVELGVRGIAGPLSRAFRSLRNRSLRKSRTNVVIGERMAEMLRDQGISENRIAIIPNWTSEDSIRPVIAQDNPLRAEWGFDERHLVVGYSGNLGRAHDLQTVIEAADILRDRDDIRFLFIGGGHLRGLLEEERKTRQLGNIETRPYQPRERLPLSMTVPEIHWISLKPELEGMIVPSKFYSAAASGRAIAFIGDADGEIARMIARADCGRSFQPGNSKELANWLSEMADRRDELAAMGVRARALIDRVHRREMAFDRFADVFDATPKTAAPEIRKPV